MHIGTIMSALNSSEKLRNAVIWVNAFIVYLCDGLTFQQTGQMVVSGVTSMVVLVHSHRRPEYAGCPSYIHVKMLRILLD
jgi:hypothetical protein